ncbi:MAG: glycosyltransferase [bacterium]|nr:glycosyltransferase [bacterium]
MNILNLILAVSTLLYIAVALSFWRGLFKPFTPVQDGVKPFLSVVIAARDEEDYIADCLQSLVAQTYPSDRFEVLVVDDDSSDATAQIVETFAHTYPHIRLLSVGTEFDAMAAKKRPMSVGIKNANSEWILTTDADCRVPPTWLEHLSVYMHSNTDAIIGFSQIKSGVNQLTLFERLQACDFLSLMSAAAGSTNLGYPLAATGQNFIYRKSLFNQVGGFSTISNRPSGDDVLLLQLFKRFSKRQFLFASDPKTFVTTHRSESLAGFWRQRKRWASNADYQIRLNPAFFLYILVVFAHRALIPISLLFFPHFYGVPIGCWLAGASVDWLVINQGARTFHRTDLLPVWPIWEFMQPFYILLIGIAGTFGGFTWKDRHHP